MEKKTIEFTDEEYKSLVKLAFIGEWVLNAHRVEPKFTEESELTNKLYAECDKFNYGDFFYKFEDEGKELKEENVLDILVDIHEYDETRFWDILCNKLAMRDANEFMAEMIFQDKEIEPEFYTNMVMDMEEEYKKEFENGGFYDLRMMPEIDPQDN